MNDYPEVVKRIHNEFNMAGERLLQKSLGILADAEKVDVDKAKRLNELGFIKQPLLKRALQIEEETRPTATIVDTVMGYRMKYRNNKFIAYDDVKKICGKYNLILNGVENYIGFIPEKNIGEIEKFVTDYSVEDKRQIITGVDYYTLPEPSNMTMFWFPSFKKKPTIDLKAVVEKFIKEYNSDPFHEKPINYLSRRGTTNSIASEINRILLKGSNTMINDLTFKSVSPFMICAPEKDMVEKMITFKEVEHVPDPIVLYPVNLGFIIVTAWGDEASDPLVVNQQMN